MSVKSTIDLTREEALNLYREMLSKRLFVVELSDEELENMLEAMDDEDHGGESFNNYRIVHDQPPHRPEIDNQETKKWMTKYRILSHVRL